MAEIVSMEKKGHVSTSILAFFFVILSIQQLID